MVLNKKKLIEYWIKTSEQDYKTMLNLYKTKDFSWSLFLGHLVIEKLLKALYVQNVSVDVPRIHDLLRLSEKAKIKVSEEQKDILDTITTFNISVRYPDYKQSFYKKCTCEFSALYIKNIKEMRKWLLVLIKK